MNKEKWIKDYDEIFELHSNKLRNTPSNVHYFALGHTKEKDYVLDVGCFSGQLSILLKDKGRNSTGIDVSHKSVKYCESKSKGIVYTQMFVEELQFQDELFDCVCAIQVIEHLEDHIIAIKEMLRVLKKGGKLIITVPIKKELDDNGLSKHLHYWDFYQLMHLFEEFGDNFKIYWLNKWHNINPETDEPHSKNIFGVVFEK